MGLIVSIKHIEDKLAGRKSNQDQRKSAQKDTHTDAVCEQKNEADTNHSSTENDTRLGRKVDTTA